MVFILVQSVLYIGEPIRKNFAWKPSWARIFVSAPQEIFDRIWNNMVWNFKVDPRMLFVTFIWTPSARSPHTQNFNIWAKKVRGMNFQAKRLKRGKISKNILDKSLGPKYLSEYLQNFAARMFNLFLKLNESSTEFRWFCPSVSAYRLEME